MSWSSPIVSNAARANGTICCLDSGQSQMQPRIACDAVHRNNTVGGILIASPAERAQSVRSFFMYAISAGTGASRET